MVRADWRRAGGRPCRWRLVGRRTSAVSCPPRAARGVTGLAAAGSRCPVGLVRPGPRHARLRSRWVIEIPCRQRKIADYAPGPAGRAWQAWTRVSLGSAVRWGGVAARPSPPIARSAAPACKARPLWTGRVRLLAIRTPGHFRILAAEQELLQSDTVKDYIAVNPREARHPRRRAGLLPSRLAPARLRRGFIIISAHQGPFPAPQRDIRFTS